MLNTLLLNTQTLNSPGVVGAVGVGVSLSFNGYSFQTATVVTNRLARDNGPSRDLAFQRIPRSNGQVLLSHFWTQRIITIRGVLSADTRVELDEAMKEMKTALSVTEGTLIIPDGNNQLVTTASWSNPDVTFDREAHYQNTFVEYQIQFMTSENPFLLEPSYSSSAFFAQTSLDFSEQIDVTGNADIEPVFILIFSAVTDVDHIKITNNTTGESVEADVTLIGGSVVEVSRETLKFIVDGTEVDYDGFFPSLKNGANSFNIEMTKVGGGGSPSATYDLTVKWKNAFI